MLGFFAYQDFTTCSLESRDITLCSSCVADLGVKVIKGEGGRRILTRLWSEDSSTPVSLESQNQPKKGKPKQDQQNRQQPEKAKSNTNQRNKGGRGQVLKNLTRLWPGSSSTLTGDKWNRKSPNTQEIKVR